ncbi:hypothetical protein ACFQ9Q_42440, partial [Streptomyces virginiae]|uniref:hypothetical protein n=1 Tax=Streptomyces virginiae TaxID=1961 RepID=UPI0036934014
TGIGIVGLLGLLALVPAQPAPERGALRGELAGSSMPGEGFEPPTDTLVQLQHQFQLALSRTPCRHAEGVLGAT